MAPRFYVPTAHQRMTCDLTFALPATAARHVQVLRLQPGDEVTLFDGEQGGVFVAQVTHMGRSDVQVQVQTWQADAAAALGGGNVHLVVGMPANERMDWLVEKATELGVRSIQPVMTQRTVVKLQDDRAEKRQAHWQAIAVSGCEQSGRNLIPTVHRPKRLAEWWKETGAGLSATSNTRCCVLSLAEGSQHLMHLFSADVEGCGAQPQDVYVLVGPEGGLSLDEEALALERGFSPVSLGPYVLRAETAALAAVSCIQSLWWGRI